MGQSATDILSSDEFTQVMPYNTPDSYLLSSNIDPAWHKKATRIILELTKLHKGWDSYNAVPVDPQLGLTALVILNAIMKPATPFPSIVPTSRGGIQLEWHTNGVDLEIDIMSDVLVDLYFNIIDDPAPEIEKQIFTYNLEPLAALTEKLVSYNSTSNN